MSVDWPKPDITPDFFKLRPGRSITMNRRMKDRYGFPYTDQETLTLYPLEDVLTYPFLSFYGFAGDLDKLLAETPRMLTRLLQEVTADWKGAPMLDVAGEKNTRILAEMPGGATRRLFDDDGTTAKTWWTLRNTAQIMQSIPDFRSHLTPARCDVLARVIAGPLDVDLKHWEPDLGATKRAIDTFAHGNEQPIEQQIIRLGDGRQVVKVHLSQGNYDYCLDMAQHVGTSRDRVLTDYRSGPQQPQQANTSGYLTTHNGDLCVAFNSYGFPFSAEISFPEYPGGHLHALCAAAKLARVKMLSRERNASLNANACERFRLRLEKLLREAEDLDKKNVLHLPNFRVTEFITDMLIAATASRKPPIKTMGSYGIVENVASGVGGYFMNIMVRYGIAKALFPDGFDQSAQGRNCLDNLIHFNPNDPFSVMRFIQDMDPTNRFNK